MATYKAGTLVKVTSNFVDTDTNDYIDPTHVILKFTQEGLAIPVIYVYESGSGAQFVTNPSISNPTNDVSLWTLSGGAHFITKVATGLYTALLDTTALPGLWTYSWIGRGAVGQSIDANTFLVVAAPL
jgi:hypothetical protein